MIGGGILQELLELNGRKLKFPSLFRYFNPISTVEELLPPHSYSPLNNFIKRLRSNISLGTFIYVLLIIIINLDHKW